MNKTDHMWLIQYIKRVRERTPRSFGGVTFTPKFVTQYPTDFKSRPTAGIHETAATGKLSASFLFNCPMAIAEQFPMAHVKCHLSPSLNPIKGFAAQIAHDFWISAHLCVSLKVFIAPATEYDSIGLKGGYV